MEVFVQTGTVADVIKDLGISPTGDIQTFLTADIHKYLTACMPYLTGALSTKQTRIASQTSIDVAGPSALYLYFGKRMVNAATGKGPAKIPKVGYRWPEGAKLRATDTPLQYTQTFNLRAGPLWDQRMMAEFGDAITGDVLAMIKIAGDTDD